MKLQELALPAPTDSRGPGITDIGPKMNGGTETTAASTGGPGRPGEAENPKSLPGNESKASSNGGVSPATDSVKSCAGCGAVIIDRFLLHAMDRYWHTGCLKCSCCQAQLGEIGTSCFAKAGMILCKNDYLRMFGSSGTCSSCGQNIPANELVMRAQGSVYHVKCFTCVVCHNKLVTGDRYSILNGSLICEHDYPKIMKGTLSLPLRPSHKVC